MSEEILTKNNKTVLRENITQPLLMFLMVALAATVLFAPLYFYVVRTEYSKETSFSIWLFWISFVSFIIVYFYFLIKHLKLPIQDLFIGKKKVQLAELKEKRTNVKYTYSLNTLVDLTTQPALVEYFFIFEDREFLVSRDDYFTFNKGDKLKLSFSYYSMNLVQIEIVKN